MKNHYISEKGQSKIDELLKLVDVSAGSMALGESRPEAPQFTEFYKPAHPNRILI